MLHDLLHPEEISAGGNSYMFTPIFLERTDIIFGNSSSTLDGESKTLSDVF
jgi:hypothetical protein